jgi:hypothetical protein
MSLLLHNASDQTSGHGATTLTDVEALAGFGSDRAVSLQDHLDVVARHHHLVSRTVGEAEIGSLI